MVVTLVEINVKPDKVEAFKKATIENHKGSIQEEGNLRFDVLQSHEDQTQFVLYEVYRSSHDAVEHKQTLHYLKWKKEVEPYMASPRKGRPHKVLAPEDEKQW